MLPTTHPPAAVTPVSGRPRAPLLLRRAVVCLSCLICGSLVLAQTPAVERATHVGSRSPAMHAALALRTDGDYAGALPHFRAAVVAFERMGARDSADLAAYRVHDSYVKAGDFAAAVRYREDTLAARLLVGGAHARGLFYSAEAVEARMTLEIDRLLAASDSSYALLRACCATTGEFVDAASGSATVLVHFGRTGEALARGKEAVAAARANAEAQPRTVGIALFNLALAEQVANRREASARHFAQAYRALEPALPPGHHLRANVANAAAGAQMYIDRFDQALVFFREALAETDGDTTTLRASVLGDYADFLDGIGAPREAAVFLGEANAVIGAVGAPYTEHHSLVIEYRLRLADVLVRTNQLARAALVIERAERGVAGVEDAGTVQTIGAALALAQGGHALASGRPAEGEAFAKTALRIASGFLEGGTPLEVKTLALLGEAQLAQGRAAEAAGSFRRALSLADEIESEELDDRTIATVGLLEAELLLDHVGVARRLAEDLLATMAARQLQRPNGLRTVAVATAFARVEAAAPGEIDPAQWTQLGRLIEDALRLPGVVAATFASTEGVAADLSTALRKGAVAAAGACGSGFDEGACGLALRLADLSHAIRLQERSRRAQGTAEAGLPDSVLARSREIDAAILAWTQIEATASRRAAALDSLRRARALHESFLRLTYPGYHLAYAAPVLELDALQTSSLETGVAYLTFVVDSAAGTLARLYADGGGVRAATIAYDARFRKRVAEFRMLVGDAGDARSLAEVGHALYRTLLGGLGEELRGRAVVIAEGRGISGLPWGALLTSAPAPTEEMRTWPWLASETTLAYADAFRSGQLVTQRPGIAYERRVAGVVPGFDDGRVSFAGARGGGAAPVRTPWSAQLVEWLASQFGASALTGGEATEAGVFAAARTAEVLHLGTHGYLDAAEPLQSFLALASRSAAADEDGRLHAYEIYPRAIDSRLAVLPVCHSGVGAYTAGDGALSLATAVRAAGCPTVVQSLWAVDDQQTNDLLRGFYERLFSGRASVAEAIRGAQLDYLETAPSRLQHPYYWAGLSVVGVDQRLEAARSPVPAWLPWVAGAVATLAIGAYALRRRRRA